MSQETGEARYLVTSSPHIFAKDSVQSIMLDVLIAMAPAAVVAGYYFGVRAIALILISIVACCFFEYGFQKITKQKVTITDYSAVVTGVLLAFNLPASAPMWVPIVGSLFAIVVAKQVFGGLGQNFINPALASRAFLLASYPQIMTDWSQTPLNITPSVAGSGATEIVSSATPLALLERGFNPAGRDLVDAFLGLHGGTIGEVCAVALLIGGIYLIIRKVISWHIPTFYIGTVFILSLLLGRSGVSGSLTLATYEILTGGLFLGAFFMATDYASSPITLKGKIIFAVGCGFITFILRYFSSSYPEGVSYSILLMNLMVPLIDRFTKPEIYGKVVANDAKDN